MRSLWPRLLAAYYGALVVFAVVCLVLDLTPEIPGWLIVVATCAPIALILFRDT